MADQETRLSTTTLPQRNKISKFFLYSSKIGQALIVLTEGFYLIFKNKMYKNHNDPKNTRYVQYFCRRIGQVFNIHVEVHGDVPRHTALWVSNHISWLDIAVLGAGARTFFLAKAEVESWPILGKLAKWGGTLFIRRGSGDSVRVKEQITEFLKNDTPVLFFPEATTSDGTYIKKVHGKLLAAAIEAKKPVQVCVICYVNEDGELDQHVPFVGEQSFADNVAQVLQMRAVTAHLMAMPSINASLYDVESLTQEVSRLMNEGLVMLHQRVLKH